MKPWFPPLLAHLSYSAAGADLFRHSYRLPTHLLLSYFGTGASGRKSVSDLRSRHSAFGILAFKVSTFSFTCLGVTAPGITETTEGWPSGKASAASASFTR